MLKKMFSDPKGNWGRICLLVFIVLFVLSALTASNKRSSSDFGPFKVFARYDAKSKGIIKDPPKRLRVIIQDEPVMDIDPANLGQNKNSKYKLEKNPDGLVIDSINLNISEKELADLWHSVTAISRSPEGNKVDYDLDARLSSIHGIYVIKDNTIIKHYYQETQIYFVLLVVILMPIVYLVGKLVIFIINRKKSV